MTPKYPSVMPSLPATFSGKRFLSEKEVAAIYGFCCKTLRNWRVLGRGPRFKKFGKSVMYQVAGLEAWIEAQPGGGDGVPTSSLKRRKKGSTS